MLVTDRLIERDPVKTNPLTSHFFFFYQHCSFALIRKLQLNREISYVLPTQGPHTSPRLFFYFVGKYGVSSYLKFTLEDVGTLCEMNSGKPSPAVVSASGGEFSGRKYTRESWEGFHVMNELQGHIWNHEF